MHSNFSIISCYLFLYAVLSPLQTLLKPRALFFLLFTLNNNKSNNTINETLYKKYKKSIPDVKFPFVLFLKYHLQQFFSIFIFIFMLHLSHSLTVCIFILSLYMIFFLFFHENENEKKKSTEISSTTFAVSSSYMDSRLISMMKSVKENLLYRYIAEINSKKCCCFCLISFFK